MSDTAAPNRRLRRDLHTVPVRGPTRPYRIVIDEIAGSFGRVSERVWKSLRSGGTADGDVWVQARAAGWTRERTEAARQRFSPLYFRVPLGSIDPIARRMAPLSGFLFSPAAIVGWSAVVLLAAMLVATRWTQLRESLTLLPSFLQQTNPLLLGGLFVATKIVHEMAHAIMCRRAGSRCGRVGVLFLCGIPCPYCDVTDVWRQPSTVRRAAVMLAGIYVELIIAAIASLIWAIAGDPEIRLHALNLMILCGISTIVFNANPLMRYDGYYVLSDLLESTNLRQESRFAFRSLVVSRVAGTRYAVALRHDPRTIGLATYWGASAVYRVFVSIAIASLLVLMADYLNLRNVAVALIVIAAAATVGRSVKGLSAILRGQGNWTLVGKRRRGIVVGFAGLLAAGVLFTPLPRYRSARGHVDAASAVNVYIRGGGIVQSVSADVGQTVHAGDTLALVVDDAVDVQRSDVQGRLRVANLRSDLARRVSLENRDAALHWKTLRAAADSLDAQLTSIRRRADAARLRAPVTGTVLPPSASTEWPLVSPSLKHRRGTAVESHQTWCRVSPDGSLVAVLLIDAVDRGQIDVGAEVRVSLAEAPETVYSTRVVSVSENRRDRDSATRAAAYRVLCPLPEVAPDELICWSGKECTGVFCLPRRTFAESLSTSIREWLSGRE